MALTVGQALITQSPASWLTLKTIILPHFIHILTRLSIYILVKHDVCGACHTTVTPTFTLSLRLPFTITASYHGRNPHPGPFWATLVLQAKYFRAIARQV